MALRLPLRRLCRLRTSSHPRWYHRPNPYHNPRSPSRKIHSLRQTRGKRRKKEIQTQQHPLRNARYPNPLVHLVQFQRQFPKRRLNRRRQKKSRSNHNQHNPRSHLWWSSSLPNPAHKSQNVLHKTLRIPRLSVRNQHPRRLHGHPKRPRRNNSCL